MPKTSPWRRGKPTSPCSKGGPAGNEEGGFRLVPDGVLLFAKGMSALRIEEWADHALRLTT
jgi:hypothetical protein